ncbi:MAG: hypothetical protein D6E12_01360 [Desulfovibrio sp.]|nr:MAG: hypothetical protein D6E12_01360 [Desulfovibrio sp.]
MKNALFAALLLVVALAVPLMTSAQDMAVDMDCEALVTVHDADGTPILTFQTLFVGMEPYEPWTAWDWQAYYASNFYKTTIENLSGHDLRFIRAHHKLAAPAKIYCLNDAGEFYECGEYSEETVEYSDDTVLLKDLLSNTLPAGEVSVFQGAYTYEHEQEYNELRGNKIFDTYTIEFQGTEYQFETCNDYH